MTHEEKIEKIASIVGEDDNKVLCACLFEAKSKILNTLYPFGNIDLETEVPARYEYQEIELAVVIYNKKGAEGQSSHGENGVSRIWESELSILSKITPMAGLPK